MKENQLTKIMFGFIITVIIAIGFLISTIMKIIEDEEFVKSLIFTIVFTIFSIVLFLIASKINTENNRHWNEREEYKKRQTKRVEDSISKNIKQEYPENIDEYNINNVLNLIRNRNIKNPHRVRIVSSDFYNTLIKEETLTTFSSYAKEKKMNNFQFVEISKSNKSNVSPGSYIYKFDEDGNLLLLKTSFVLIDNEYPFYDVTLESEVIKFENKNIKSFKEYGSEMMKSTIKTDVKESQTSLIGTMFSEMLFGTAYTLINGLKESQVNISTVHEVHDTRHVQIIFEDNNDLIFAGINILYDLNRYIK